MGGRLGTADALFEEVKEPRSRDEEHTDDSEVTEPRVHGHAHVLQVQCAHVPRL